MLTLIGNIISIGSLVYLIKKANPSHPLFNEIKNLIFFACGWIALSLLLGTAVLFDKMERQMVFSDYIGIVTQSILIMVFIGSGILNVLVLVYTNMTSKTK